jgi:hypothetical protein
MDPLSLLAKFGLTGLSTEEEAELTRELSAAYHLDESAATSRDVQRIAEKVRARMNSLAEASPENGSRVRELTSLSDDRVAEIQEENIQ